MVAFSYLYKMPIYIYCSSDVIVFLRCKYILMKIDICVVCEFILIEMNGLITYCGGSIEGSIESETSPRLP